MAKGVVYQQRYKDFYLYCRKNLEKTRDKQTIVSCVLEKHNVPCDVWRTIWEYCFFHVDVARLKWEYKQTVRSFVIACSRRNGFWDDSTYDTEEEHWVFYVSHGLKHVRLEAINCSTCGNYILSSTLFDDDNASGMWCHCLL